LSIIKLSKSTLIDHKVKLTFLLDISTQKKLGYLGLGLGSKQINNIKIKNNFQKLLVMTLSINFKNKKKSLKLRNLYSKLYPKIFLSFFEISN
jgi:hypothetical protein